VSTVRFSKVLEACGKPDIHLLLIDPAKDKTLQAAIKSDRVMTLYQQSGGTDHGVVGFEQGRSRQFLVFPKPLKPFLGQRIVGIKYELIDDTPAPKKEAIKKEAPKSDEPAPAKQDKRDQEDRKPVSEDKVIKFQKTEPEKPPAAEADEIAKLKQQVREAMDALEQGKQVVAFNLLKRILDADENG
jgi:hypothetical protein